MAPKTTTGPTVGAAGPVLKLNLAVDVIQMHESVEVQEDIDVKQTANLRARFALAGFQLHVVHPRGGTQYFAIPRWNEKRQFRSLHDVESFATQVGAR